MLRVDPGKRVYLQDVLIGSEHTVQDRSGSHYMKSHDLLFGRVAAIDEVNRFIGLAPDHVHICVESDGEKSLEAIVKKLKSASSKAIIQMVPHKGNVFVLPLPTVGPFLEIGTNCFNCQGGFARPYLCFFGGTTGTFPEQSFAHSSPNVC